MKGKGSLTVLNISGIYEREPWMCSRKDCWISFTALEGTDGYCTEEAASEIRRVLSDYTGGGIHFLDSGNYHYVTKFWLEKIRSPFDLAVFDRHSDLQPPGLLPLTSCGGWLLEVLEEQKYLQDVWLIGPPEEVYQKIPEAYRDRVKIIGEQEAVLGQGMERLLPPENRRPVYLSIDKDVLREEDAPTNWDQGNMTLETLIRWLRHIGSTVPVIGADICGESAENGSFPELAETCRKNDKVNQILADCLDKIIFCVTV